MIRETKGLLLRHDDPGSAADESGPFHIYLTRRDGVTIRMLGPIDSFREAERLIPPCMALFRALGQEASGEWGIVGEVKEPGGALNPLFGLDEAGEFVGAELMVDAMARIEAEIERRATT